MHFFAIDAIQNFLDKFYDIIQKHELLILIAEAPLIKSYL